LLETCRIADVDPTQTKRHRLYNAFAQEQNQRQNRTCILGFIRHAKKPERFTRFPERFEPMRAHLNRALAFAGLAMDASGTLATVEQARTLSEAQHRAQELRAGPPKSICRRHVIISTPAHFFSVWSQVLRPFRNAWITTRWVAILRAKFLIIVFIQSSIR
jgi:hypothetical protein